MKVIEECNRNIYEKKVNIEISVGELLILKAIAGDTSSARVSLRLKGNHAEFAKLINEEDLEYKIYHDLTKTCEELLGGNAND